MGMNSDYIIIENNGIGYKIYTSGSTMINMPQKSDEVIIYTIQIVKDDGIYLYGFLTKDELELFNMLLKVNGVGPKAALSLLSISNVENLKKAIASKDEVLIKKAPGIGKKTAERIILELKDKINVQNLDLSCNDEKNIDEKIKNDTLAALINLGYSEREANKAINSVEGNSVEEVIKNCLKYLMNWGDKNGE